MFRDTGAANYCDNGRDLKNCPIGDVAPFDEYENLIAEYLQAKFLQSYENNLAAEKIYQRSGLFDDLDALMSLENVWSEYKRIKNTEAQMKRKHGR